MYVGVECGLDDVLKFLDKGNTVSDIREQCGRLNDLGIRHMDMLMLGTAGRGRGEECAIAYAELCNAIFWAAHAMDSVRIAGYIGESREKMLEILQYSIDTIDEEKFAKTFRRDHI